MKSNRSRYLHYAKRKNIIFLLIDSEKNRVPCLTCINFSYCLCSDNWLCPENEHNHYKPVKIRKVIMKKLIKRRKRHEK